MVDGVVSPYISCSSIGSSIKSSSLSDSEDDSGLVEKKSLAFERDCVKIPPPYVPALPVAAGRSREGRSAAFKMVGLEFCISAILEKEVVHVGQDEEGTVSCK